MSVKHHTANSKMAKSKLIEGSPAEEAAETPKQESMETAKEKRAEALRGIK